MASSLSQRPWALTQNADEFSQCQFIIDALSNPPRILHHSEVETENGKSGFQMRYWGWANCPAMPNTVINDDIAMARYARAVQSVVVRHIIEVRIAWSRK